ncbi:amidohydrolase [Vibrio harveyi]|uniref:amidohydrolase n=1 Tax=Vibrio harveyi TaxID=669 RepID=UPI003CFA0221
MLTPHRRILGAVLLSAFSAWANAAEQTADMVYINAGIYGHPQADAVAVRDGRIAFIGDKAKAQAWVGDGTLVVDLSDTYLLPGFVDNHNHVFEAASEAGGTCLLQAGVLLDEQIPQLQDCKEFVQDGDWLMGYGFTLDATLSEENQRTPLEVIDEVFPDTPVVLMEQTSHSMWVNSAALKAANIDKTTSDPQGGRILKDPDTGELNGILLDNAGDLVMELAWNSMSAQFAVSYQGLLTGLEEAALYGITTIGDGRMYWKRGWYEVWKESEKRGDLTARVSLRPWIYPTDSMDSQLTYLKRIQSDDTSRLLLVNQVKMYSDGIFINGTAKTLAPYLDTYLPDSPYGLNYISPKVMPEWLNKLDKLGYSAHIHAIGDGGIRESLNAIETMRSQGNQRRYTLTHVELVNSKDVPRFAKLDVTADFQVGSDYVAYHEHQWAEAFLGAKRTRALMNLRALYNTKANVTLSSDWNVHDLNPLVGISNSLVMGDTGLPNVTAAIDAYTIHPAYSLGLEKEIGSIDVGKSADFAVLDQDITQLKAQDIAQARVLMTVLRGEVVYEQIDDE